MQQNIIEHLKAVKEWAEQQPQREGAPPCPTAIGHSKNSVVELSQFGTGVCQMQDHRVLDKHIRGALKCTLRAEDNTAAIIDELPLLRGRGRADLAFVNGQLRGYEIKSEADSLARLGEQAENYQSVFEFITLVATRKHLKLARKRIPLTWGIMEAKDINGQIHLIPRRRARRNRHINNSALVRILWKNECLRVFGKRGNSHSAPTRSSTGHLELNHTVAYNRTAMPRSQRSA